MRTTVLRHLHSVGRFKVDTHSRVWRRAPDLGGPHNQLPDVLEKSFFSSLEEEHLANVKSWKEHEAPVSQEESEVHLRGLW